MKKILACASLFFAVATASAQGALEQNKVQINGGVGLSGFGVPVYLGLQIGGRYFFTKNLGLNLQFGGGINTFGGRIGLTYKL